MMMPLFNFSLTLSGVTADTEGLEDTLFNAGCGDALVCFYGTAVYLEFDREAETLAEAVLSAIHNIESCELNARVESVDSTLVGLSDIAELTGMTRQAIALLKKGTRGSRQFPGPVQRVKGNSPIWHWRVVVDWLASEGRLAADSPLIAHAHILDSLNMALQLRSSMAKQSVLGYLQQIEQQAE
jgi:hypothetical protein